MEIPPVLNNKKEKWTLEKIREGFESFHQETGRYPTANEVNVYPHLPAAKTIERKFGGLPQLRQKLGIDGPLDFTKGEYSSRRAKLINERSNKIEKKIYDELVERFGKPFVHREYFFTDDRRTRADFYVYGKNIEFLVDVFYPKDQHSLLGCLNSKLKTYGNISHMIPSRVIFLMMNRDMKRESIQELIANKKKKLTLTQHVMMYDEFKRFLMTVTPRMA